MSETSFTRRSFLRASGLVAAGLLAPRAFAGELAPTPPQTAGPFYPDHLPLDRDNDLVSIGGSDTTASGQITHLSGRILDTSGNPIANALVEIWQADSRGVYLHSRSWNRETRDAGFQGYGRFNTGAAGEYRFRTIKPVPYPGRTPHIHFAVTVAGNEKLTTQCYVKDEPMNAGDYLYNSILDPKARESVTVAFAPDPAAPAGEMVARFDVVLGNTPRA